MGYFWGHMDEGLFFILLAVWWMICAFREYVLEQSQGHTVKPKISYDANFKRPVPLETLFKLLFPIVGIMGELLDGGIRFQDADGNFVKLVYQQHMTIYGIFILHGVIDLLTWLGFPIFPSLNYMSAVMSFFWYGTAFFYHASMHGKAPVETAVHIMPVYVMFLVGIAVFLEHVWREGVWTMVVRAYGLLTLGTWFSHVSFMLYVSDKFPGGESSDLDRTDPSNVTYVKAMFGMHLFVNLVITLVLYVSVYVTLKVRLGYHISAENHQTSTGETRTKAMFGMLLFVNLVITLVLYVISYVTLNVQERENVSNGGRGYASERVALSDDKIEKRITAVIDECRRQLLRDLEQVASP